MNNHPSWPYPIGQRVIYTDAMGVEHETATRSPVWALGDGRLVVSLEGRIGGYALTHLRALTDPPSPGSKEAGALGCLCPVIDNERRRGYHGQAGVFVRMGNCPLHGEESEPAAWPEKGYMETCAKPLAGGL